MTATPLTSAEIEAMPRSSGALWPRGIVLRCHCGKVGVPAGVEGHRGRSSSVACKKRPEAFRTIEEADERQAEVEVAQELEDRDRVGAAALTLAGAPSTSETEQRRGPGRVRPVRGEGKTASAIRSEAPGRATVRVSVDMLADGFARYDRVRLDPEYGFSGDPGEYLNACEVALWRVIDWLAGGMAGPITIRLAA